MVSLQTLSAPSGARTPGFARACFGFNYAHALDEGPQRRDLLPINRL
jgi:hypothetical protein